jgi:hypothetical protein
VNNALALVLLWGPAQSDSGVTLIKEEDHNVLCVTPLACRSPSDSNSFSDCFDSQSLVDDDDLGSFTEMDESSDEDLDIFVAMDIVTLEASEAAGGLQLLRRAVCVELVLVPLSEAPLREWMVLVH